MVNILWSVRTNMCGTSREPSSTDDAAPPALPYAQVAAPSLERSGSEDLAIDASDSPIAIPIEVHPGHTEGGLEGRARSAHPSGADQGHAPRTCYEPEDEEEEQEGGGGGGVSGIAGRVADASADATVEAGVVLQHVSVSHREPPPPPPPPSHCSSFARSPASAYFRFEVLEVYMCVCLYVAYCASSAWHSTAGLHVYAYVE
jgi:hypothetical protein